MTCGSSRRSPTLSARGLDDAADRIAGRGGSLLGMTPATLAEMLALTGR